MLLASFVDCTNNLLLEEQFDLAFLQQLLDVLIAVVGGVSFVEAGSVVVELPVFV